MSNTINPAKPEEQYSKYFFIGYIATDCYTARTSNMTFINNEYYTCEELIKLIRLNDKLCPKTGEVVITSLSELTKECFEMYRKQ